jgi:hypothetical protein
MNIYILLGLRAAALALNIAGEKKSADRLYAAADGIEAGTMTEAHMAIVAEKLKQRTITDEDWNDVDQRIAEDQSRLHSP